MTRKGKNKIQFKADGKKKINNRQREKQNSKKGKWKSEIQ